jgi:uncharacterized protein (TIGR02680 family)
VTTRSNSRYSTNGAADTNGNGTNGKHATDDANREAVRLAMSEHGPAVTTTGVTQTLRLHPAFAAARPTPEMRERIAAVTARRVISTPRWEPVRAIVQNYFVIPYQEFHFVNGCLVLGGANSTGKTSVLTALVTLVLDNDKRPQRFDPSGQRVRSIGYYVLGKPEMRFYHKNRISYLALEFRHTGTGQYRTIGIGIQGHRAGADGQPQVEGWGFLLADGRRIGPDHDITLFDDVGGKPTPLSRARLVKALGTDVNTVNRVVDDIDAYRDMVNAALFGFHSEQQFEDLLSILTSLRGSKLANTIKPSVVNGFLQQSLRPLDENLMEDAGRIYERIDQYQERLDVLASQVIVLDDLAKAEANWRLAGARREAGLYREAYRESERALKRLERVREDIAREQAAVDAAEDAMADERTKKEAKVGRLKVLRQREELKDIDKLAEYQARLTESTALATRARGDADSARARREEVSERVEALFKEWNDVLGDVVRRGRELADETRSAWATAESFATAVVASARQASITTTTMSPRITLSAVLADHEVQRDSLQDISRALRALESVEYKHQTAREQRDLVAGELTAASEALQERREEERAGRSRGADQLRLWAESALAEIPLASDVIETVISQVLDTDIEPEGLTDPLVESIDVARTSTRTRHATAIVARNAAQARVDELEQRLREKEAEKEESPPARPERTRARAAMNAAGIDVLPLYQAVDFAASVAERDRGRFERILEDAGLLDSLILRTADHLRAREAIAALPGSDQLFATETWLSAGTSGGSSENVGSTLADYLIVAALDGATEATTSAVTAALRAVRVFVDTSAMRAATLTGTSAVALDGGWMHGALVGHTTGARERGRYIGRANRERARAEAIALLRSERDGAVLEHDRFADTAERLTVALRDIDDHERTLRGLSTIRVLPVLRSQVISADQHVTTCEDRLAVADQRVAQTRAAVTEAKHQVDTACRAIQWNGERSQDAIDRAINALERFRERANDLQRRVDTTLRLAQDHAAAAARLPSVREAVTTAESFVRERDLAVIRDSAQVQAIQDLLKRDDIRQLTREVGELEFAIGRHGETIDEHRTARDSAGGRLESAEKELPERETTEESARVKALAQLERFVLALAAHAVMADDATRARRSDAEAATVADGMLKGLSSAEAGSVALDAAREAGFNAMDRIRVQHTSVLTLLQPAVDREAGYSFLHHGRQLTTIVLLAELADEQVKLEATLGEDQRALAQKFMSEEILSAIHGAIQDTHELIQLVNAKLGQIKSTKSKQLRFVWRAIALPGMTTNVAEVAKLLGTRVTYWSDEDRAMLVRFIEERLAYVRTKVKADDATVSYVEALKDALDYRNWYEFTMETHEKRWVTFTDKEFGSGSEGEKAVDMLSPLFAVVHARYANAAADAPRLIGMDEAMAGLDATNTKALFGLLNDFEFAFVMTSEKLWGVSENLPGCATYQLQVDHPKDPSAFAATMFLWDGVERTEDDLHRLSESTAAPGAQRELVL